MNERIRQLLSQAGVHYEVLPKDTVYEKFAQLIVRECLSQVDKMDAILEDDKEKIGVAWVGLAIAKHFGVES